MELELYLMLCLFYSRNQSLSAHDVATVLNTQITVVAEPLLHLLESGYLRMETGSYKRGDPFSFKAKLCITYDGKLAIKSYEKSRKLHFWIEFRAWATLAIALIALVVSIASLLLQWT